MAKDYIITATNAASYTVDHTDPDVNPEAAPTSTPRQGGFTLRNRINFTNVSAANKTLFAITKGTAATAGKVFRVLEVPERVVVNDVKVFAVRDETVPGLKMMTASSAASGVTASGLGNSHLATLVLGVNAEQRSKPTSASSYADASHLDLLTGAQDGMVALCAFGNIPTLVSASGTNLVDVTLSAAKVEAVGSSMTAPELGMMVTKAAGTGSAVYDHSPQYFPLGGYVYVGAVSPSSVTGSDSSGAGTFTGDNLQFTGTWDFQAQCQYIPE
jgi:hypothetical protein